MKKIKFLIVLLFVGVFLVLGVCSRSVVRADSYSSNYDSPVYSILNINYAEVIVNNENFYVLSDNIVTNNFNYTYKDYSVSISDNVGGFSTLNFRISYLGDVLIFNSLSDVPVGYVLHLSCGPFVIPKSYFTDVFSDVPYFDLTDEWSNLDVDFSYGVYKSNRLGGGKTFTIEQRSSSLSYADDFYLIPYDQIILSDDFYGSDYLFFEYLDITIDFNNFAYGALDGGFEISGGGINDDTKLNFLDWENNIDYSPAGGTPMLEWLTTSINAFLNTPIFGPTITIGTLMLFIVAIPLVIALLKFFVGG